MFGEMSCREPVLHISDYLITVYDPFEIVWNTFFMVSFAPNETTNFVEI